MAPNATSTAAAAVTAGHAPDVLSDEFGFQPDDVVVSGFSGRFPECDSVDELREKLYAGYDMVNDDPRRWPYGKSQPRIQMVGEGKRGIRIRVRYWVIFFFISPLVPE